MTAPPAIVFVVAIARNGVMGRNNQLPWRMRSDLKHFKAVTLGKPMIMGRKTFESIGKPLPGRETIIVTRDDTYRADGTHIAFSLDEAFVLAESFARSMDKNEIIVAGGAQIFAEAMHLADRMIVTEIDLDIGGDVVFPPINRALWREVSRTPHPRGEGDDAPFEVVVWEKK